MDRGLGIVLLCCASLTFLIYLNNFRYTLGADPAAAVAISSAAVELIYIHFFSPWNSFTASYVLLLITQIFRR